MLDYTDEDNYLWAGARLEKNGQSWVIGRTDGGIFSTIEEISADIPHDSEIAVRAVVDGYDIVLYGDGMEQIRCTLDAVGGTAGLIGTQNKTLVDDYLMKTLVGETREHNAVNELVSLNGEALLYDEDGNLVDDGRYIYEWDALNRLKQVRTSDGAVVVSYTVDAGNRVVSKTTAEGTTAYACQGWQAIEEVSGGSAIREYIYSGQYMDDRVCMVSGEGEFYYQTNSQFSVVSLTDSIANVTCRWWYTPYGEFETEGDSHGNPYLFTGRRYESETGLFNYRNRYYSGELGRFIQRDPAGYVDGMNLYEYGSGNPALYVDPLGTWKYVSGRGKIRITYESEPKDTIQELARRVRLSENQSQRWLKDKDNVGVRNDADLEYCEQYTVPNRVIVITGEAHRFARSYIQTYAAETKAVFDKLGYMVTAYDANDISPATAVTAFGISNRTEDIYAVSYFGHGARGSGESGDWESGAWAVGISWDPIKFKFVYPTDLLRSTDVALPFKKAAIISFSCYGNLGRWNNAVSQYGHAWVVHGVDWAPSGASNFGVESFEDLVRMAVSDVERR